MATTLTSAVLVPVTPVFSNTERLALAGFLAGYSGLTRQAYELDLRQSIVRVHLTVIRGPPRRRCIPAPVKPRYRASSAVGMTARLGNAERSNLRSGPAGIGYIRDAANGRCDALLPLSEAVSEAVACSVGTCRLAR